MEGKKTISQTMSPQQLAEAEGRAAARLKNKKQSGFDDGGEMQTGGQPQRHAAAR